MAYVLLTDSSCDLNAAKLEALNVAIVPLSFTIDGKTYKDNLGEDMGAEEFYRRVRSGQMSVTSLVNVQDFIDFFVPYLDAGKDIVYIGFSSGLSGTWSSSVQAADMLKERYPGRHIYSVDSRCASLGQGLLVQMAAEKRDEGLSAEDLALWLEENKLNICHWFTVDDLEHLFRGGRVSRVTALMGSMLKIKPVMHVDDAGKLIPMEKALGRKRSITMLTHRTAERVRENPATIFISHGDCLEDAEKLAAQVREAFPVKELYIHTVGPVIGAHSGPGTLAIFCFGSPR